MARLGSAGMSAVWPLSAYEQTCRRHREIDPTDPEQTLSITPSCGLAHSCVDAALEG